MAAEPRQDRGRERRERIVAAGADLLAREGFGVLSHRTVAERAGVPLGSTTYYFASLDELRAAAARTLVERWIAHGTRVTRRASPGEYTADAAARLLARAILPAAEPGPLQAQYELLLASARQHPDVSAVLREMRPHLLRMVDDVLARTGWTGHVGGELVLAVVDGAAVGALSERRPRVRAVAEALLTELLTRAPAGR